MLIATAKLVALLVTVHLGIDPYTSHFVVSDRVSWSDRSKQRHPSLVRVLGVCLDAREPYVLTEFVDGECLKDLLNVKRQTSHLLTRNIDIVRPDSSTAVVYPSSV